MTLAQPNNPRRGSRWWLALATLGAGVFVLLGYVLWTAYEETWRDAERSSTNYAELIEARFEASLRRLDANSHQIIAAIPPEALNPMASGGQREGIERMLKGFRVAFPEAAGFHVFDRRGNLLYKGAEGNYVNVADRGYFLQLKEGRVPDLVFSDAMASRINGKQVLVLARAMRDEKGEFLGMVSAALDLGYFDQLFRSVRLGERGVLAVRRSDNDQTVIQFPANLAADAVPRLALRHNESGSGSGNRSGVIEFSGGSQGTQWAERIFASRVLENFPFYVVVGLAVEDVMESWHVRLLSVACIGILLIMGLWVVLYQLFDAQRREGMANERYRQQGEQLREAQRVARVGAWELDLASGRLNWSEELRRIFERDQVPEEPTLEDFLSLVHPEDRAAVESAYQASLRTHSAYQIEHRLLLPDGRIKHVLEFAETQYSADGKPLRTIGTAQDITGVRQMEAQMQLLASAFHYSGEAIVITDRDHRIVTVNPAFSALTGYSADEAIGRNPDFLSAGRSNKTEYEQVNRALLERGFWQGEMWDRRKDGSVYPKWMSVSAIRDEQGSLRYHVAHFTDVSVERAVEAQLEHIAHHDVLTGLLNRLSLRSRLDQALATARRDGSTLALLFIDLDRFKVINDTLGHHIGDEMLIEVARRLQESVRESDVVARLGGDEFVIMLTGVDTTGAIATVAEKLVLSIGDPYQLEGHDLYTSPSIGIAIYPHDGEDGETLMKNADAAMYHAKSAGRNNFQFFDTKMNDAVLERLNIENSLRQALAHDQFLLYFQPILDIRTGRVVSVEALVRWLHPEQGLVSPARFIPIAEETGLIQPLGDWVFWTACRQLAEFNAAGIRDVKMSINISAMQMRNDNLPVIARGAIDVFNLRASELVFEITESVAMHRPDDTVRVLNSLHGMGIGLAIDDFGTGYSSLSYLKLFPIDNLKLDRAFVEEIGQGPGSATICDATISLAHSLGLRLVAEGVETEEQLNYLRSKGCDMVQGFYFSRPVPVDEIIAYIKQRNDLVA